MSYVRIGFFQFVVYTYGSSISPHSWVASLFLGSKNIPLSESTMVHLSTDLLEDILVASSFDKYEKTASNIHV